MLIVQKDLHSALGELCRVADPKAFVPILSSVLVEPGDGEIRITATDLKRRATCTLRAEGAQKSEGFVLPAKALHGMVAPEKGTNGSKMTLTRADEGRNGIAMEIGGMSISLRDFGPARDYPIPLGIPFTPQFAPLLEWPCDETAEALDWVLLAAGRDDTRKHLCCVYLSTEATGGECMVTTDGHRLHKAPLPGRMDLPDGIPDLLIPPSAAAHIARLCGQNKGKTWRLFWAGADVIQAEIGAWSYAIKLVDAKFPPWPAVVPGTDGAMQICVEPGGFTNVLKRMSKVLNGCHHKGINFLARADRLLVGAENVDDGAEIRMQIPIRSAALAVAGAETPALPTVTTGFEAGYIVDAMDGADDWIKFSIIGDLDPIRLDYAGRTAIIMPMRL